MFEYQKINTNDLVSLVARVFCPCPYCILVLIYHGAARKGTLAKAHVVTNFWTTKHYARALQEVSLMVVRSLMMTMVMAHELCNLMYK